VRDQLDKATRQAELDRSAKDAAEAEAHAARRALDLARAAPSRPKAGAPDEEFPSTPLPQHPVMSPRPTPSTLATPLCATPAASAASAASSFTASTDAMPATPMPPQSASSLPPPTPSATPLPTASSTTSSTASSSGVGATLTAISEETEAGSGDEAAEDAAALAALRLRQLERARAEQKQAGDALTAALARVAALEAAGRSSSSSSSSSSSELALRLQRAQAEAERERGAARAEREASSRLAEDVRRLAERCAASEASTAAWAEGAGRRWAAALADAQDLAARHRNEAAVLAAGAAKREELEAEVASLRQQCGDLTTLLAAEQRASGSARADAARAKAAEAERAGEAKEARLALAALAATEPPPASEGAGEAAGEDAAAAGVPRFESAAAALTALSASAAAAELAGLKAMNEAVLGEFEAMATAEHELASQNARLVALGAENDAVNKMLMTKGRQLREAKAAEAGERDALVARLAASEAHREALEEQHRAREALLRAAEAARREREAATLGREREASGAVERAARLALQVEGLEAQLAAQAGNAASGEARLVALTEEAHVLRGERDALEATAEERQRRLERALRKLGKAKGASLSSSSSGGGGGAGADDIEYRELLEFENEQLKKQVNCSIVPEKAKSVMLVKCGHAFSKEAIDKRLADRMRRCPACNEGFAVAEVKSIFLTW